MESFVKHTGVIAPLDKTDIDTDQIIPKQFLKRVERNGFGQFMFYNWRYKKHGVLNPDFILNSPLYAGCSIIATRRNFGSGSSREHAVWALSDFGIKCIIAPSFADIFYNNCFQNGILPITVDEETSDKLIEKSKNAPGYKISVDLSEQSINDKEGEIYIKFDIDKFRKYSMMNGLDDIGLTLKHEDKIRSYEKKMLQK
ncbi:MAG: 3-isopropylmalate dehydratase small subunit [SAR202 cluster bacterium]|nr:3-isopropylmalate dehydratase small subunit [Chloroflexota bacterium]MQG39719.1 3-isopropylmalate dehydratase small subunit [SAR202 cluster bacterium]|tara:strand:- start:715 stop:1311 length:597 start_codon:yes stop_codon:yes gene_type:complete